MPVPFLAVRTRSAAETSALGSRLGAILRPGEVLLLVGDLGTGKTTFVQGIARGLQVPVHPNSPTFTMVNTYEGGLLPLVHVDLYRLDNSNEVFGLGLEELFEPPAVAVVEWGERAGSVVGDHYLECEFAWEDEDDVRTIRFAPFGRWIDRTTDLSDAVQSWANPAHGSEQGTA